MFIYRRYLSLSVIGYFCSVFETNSCEIENSRFLFFLYINMNNVLTQFQLKYDQINQRILRGKKPSTHNNLTNLNHLLMLIMIFFFYKNIQKL